MNVQEAILRAIAKKITWWQAVEIIAPLTARRTLVAQPRILHGRDACHDARSRMDTSDFYFVKIWVY